MARTRRIKSEAVGTAYYHLISRTNDKRFLFDGGRVKTQLVNALKRAAAFSGVEIDAYVAMDNHFHVVCKEVRPEESVHEDELIRRVAALELLAEEGWTMPRRGVGSVLVDRGIDNRIRGRILVYSRGTGYSYYSAEFMSILDSRLLMSGYKMFVVNAGKRSELAACRAFKNLLKEKWSLVIMRGGCSMAMSPVS